MTTRPSSSTSRRSVSPRRDTPKRPTVRCAHLGAFVAATNAQAPIVPVALRGTRSMLRAGHRLVRRGHAEVEVAPPIEPLGNDWHAAVELSRVARRAVLERCGEPDTQ